MRDRSTCRLFRLVRPGRKCWNSFGHVRMRMDIQPFGTRSVLGLHRGMSVALPYLCRAGLHQVPSHIAPQQAYRARPAQASSRVGSSQAASSPTGRQRSSARGASEEAKRLLARQACKTADDTALPSLCPGLICFRSSPAVSRVYILLSDWLIRLQLLGNVLLQAQVQSA